MCFISCMVCYFFGLIGAAACTDAHCLFSCELLHVSLPTVCFDMTCCAYHCLSFVLIWPVCIFVCLMFWYDLLRVSLLIFYSDRSCGVCMCPYFFYMSHSVCHCPPFVLILAFVVTIAHLFPWAWLAASFIFFVLWSADCTIAHGL